MYWQLLLSPMYKDSFLTKEYLLVTLLFCPPYKTKLNSRFKEGNKHWQNMKLGSNRKRRKGCCFLSTKSYSLILCIEIYICEIIGEPGSVIYPYIYLVLISFLCNTQRILCLLCMGMYSKVINQFKMMCLERELTWEGREQALKSDWKISQNRISRKGLHCMKRDGEILGEKSIQAN